MNSLNRQPIALLAFDPELVHPCSGFTQGRSAPVLQMAHSLAKLGWHVDVFTSAPSSALSSTPSNEASLSQPKIREHLPFCRTVHLPSALDRTSDLVCAFQAFQAKQGVSYPVVHTQDWQSSRVGAQLKRSRAVQWVHTIWQASSVYNDTHGKSRSLEPTQRANPREIEFVFNPDEHYSDADRVVLCIPEDQPGVVGQCSGRETVPVPHSFQLSKVEAKGKFGLLPFEPVGVYVGSLHPIKGIDVLIEALALHRDQILHHAAGATVHPLKVLVVYERSDTQARHRVQQRLKELDLAQSVVWVEREPSQEWLCYAAADVRIVPSLYEPFGIEVLAALDYGLPIVASNVGGLRFTIAHEETGLLVPPNQPTALAQAIDRVVLDDLWMKRLKRQTTNPSAFAWYRTAAHLSDLYRRLLAGSLSGIMPGRPMVYSLSVPQAGSILSTPQRTEELVQVS